MPQFEGRSAYTCSIENIVCVYWDPKLKKCRRVEGCDKHIGKTTAPKNNLKEGKPQPSLIPDDVLLEFLEPAYREGLLKYSRESWRQGFKTTDLFDALKRHITAYFYNGEDWDPDAAKLGIKKHHLGGAMFCILSILWSNKTRPELDDRPGKLNQEVKDEEG